MIKLPDLFRVVLRMIYDGKNADEVYDQLSRVGIDDDQVDRIYTSIIGLIARGMDKTETVFADTYDIRRRVFTREELSVIKHVPSLYDSVLWGEISIEEFESTLTDFGGFGVD
ncbi:MAG TPA: hypothetical protein DCE14_06830 [Kosmotogaceae bacterium]|nr:MAG: Uncharacterized protein XE05_0507 [Thermotogales bacterium 46_20]HAA86039.1 hypothetical protein [Kosmotogaceae bacterium]